MERVAVDCALPSDAIKRKQEAFVKSDRRGSLQQRVQNARAAQDTAASANFSEILLTHLSLYGDEQLKRKITETLSRSATLDDVEQYLAAIRADNTAANHFGAIQLRKLLTQHYDVLVQRVIDSDCLFRLIDFAQRDEYPHLMLESAWCLTNLALGNTQQTAFLVQKGVVSVFLRVSQSPFAQIAEQGIWGIANICSDSRDNRRGVLSADCIPVLTKVYARGQPVLCKYIAWVFSLLCRFRPKAEPFEIVLPAFKLICAFIENFCTINVMECEDALIGVAALVRSETIETIASSTFIDVLCAYYKTAIQSSAEHRDGVSSAHHILGTLCVLRPPSVSTLLARGMLEQFAAILYGFSVSAVLKDVCWVLSNISAGGEHAPAFAKCPGLLDAVFRLAADTTSETGIEALWIIANLCHCKKSAIIGEFVARGAFSLFAQALVGAEKRRKLVALDAASLVFDFYHRLREWSDVRGNALGVGLGKAIERLQWDEDAEVYLKARDVLYKFFEIAN